LNCAFPNALQGHSRQRHANTTRENAYGQRSSHQQDAAHVTSAMRNLRGENATHRKDHPELG
jgi:hypothetical protein